MLDPSGLAWYDGFLRECNKEEKDWLKKQKGKAEHTATCIWSTQKLGEGWGFHYSFGKDSSGKTIKRSRVYGKNVRITDGPAWQQAGDVVHETVAAVINKMTGCTDSSGTSGDKNLRSPFVGRDGRIVGFRKPTVGSASGLHNLSLIYELAAIASRYSKHCTCDWAKRRLRTAHVYDPAGKHGLMPFQKGLEDIVAFICDCENGKLAKKKAKTEFSLEHCIPNIGLLASVDYEVAELKLDLKCKNKRVTGSYSIATYD